MHNKNKVIEKDEFNIQFSVTKDPNTNFTVTNKYYFERRFALSVIVGSDLAGNQSMVECEPSKGRIVITSNENIIQLSLRKPV